MNQAREDHSSTVLGTSLYVYGNIWDNNSIERMVNVNSLLGEYSNAYWETLIAAGGTSLSLMLPLKDSEEILIFSNQSILEFDGQRFRNLVIFNTRGRIIHENLC